MRSRSKVPGSTRLATLKTVAPSGVVRWKMENLPCVQSDGLQRFDEPPTLESLRGGAVNRRVMIFSSGGSIRGGAGRTISVLAKHRLDASEGFRQHRNWFRRVVSCRRIRFENRVRNEKVR